MARLLQTIHEMPTPRSPNDALGALTGLRFFPAIYVVLFHFFTRVPSVSRVPLVADVVSQGYVCVGLFFVLSGFILAYAYRRENFETPRSRTEFWATRFGRIYPLYAISLALSLAVQGTAGPLAQPAGKGAFAKLLLAVGLLQSWTPWPLFLNVAAWSLATEAAFYAIFPLLLPAVRAEKRLGRVFLIAWLAALLAPAVYLVTAPDGATTLSPETRGEWLSVLKYHPAARLPEFLMGVLAGVLFTRHIATLRALSGAIVDTSLVVLTTGILIALAYARNLPYPLVHNGLFSPVFAAIIVLLATGRGMLARVLATRVPTALGQASYAIYILQFPVVVILQERFHQGAVVCLGALVAVSLLGFRYVEEPCRVFVKTAVISFLARVTSSRWTRLRVIAGWPRAT